MILNVAYINLVIKIGYRVDTNAASVNVLALSTTRLNDTSQYGTALLLLCYNYNGCKNFIILKVFKNSIWAWSIAYNSAV